MLDLKDDIEGSSVTRKTPSRGRKGAVRNNQLQPEGGRQKIELFDQKIAVQQKAEEGI